MDIKDFKLAPLHTLDKEWALLTAGNNQAYNTMTVSWGGFGTIWNKPVATVYVRPNRYTYKFMEDNDYFTLSFYDESYKKDLGILGSKSGRDGDKVALTKLTPNFLDKTTTFNEAKLTLICKKLYHQDFDITNVPNEVAESVYKNEPIHRMYIGEIVDIVEI